MQITFGSTFGSICTPVLISILLIPSVMAEGLALLAGPTLRRRITGDGTAG